MRVHHLDCLTMCPPFARWATGSGGLFERGKMVCHVLLIETEKDGLLLVDTAIGLDDCADTGGRLGTHLPLLRPRRRRIRPNVDVTCPPARVRPEGHSH
jgi:hypothetical protein